MYELLEQRDADRKRQREILRLRVRRQLKAALHRVVPGQRVYVFGSLIHPHTFHERSDADIAFVTEPTEYGIYRLQSMLEELVHRPVDLLLLEETRLKDKILREGELWIS